MYIIEHNIKTDLQITFKYTSGCEKWRLMVLRAWHLKGYVLRKIVR